MTRKLRQQTPAIATIALAVLVALACRADEKLEQPVVLAIATPDARLAPDVPLRVKGSSLRGLTASIGTRRLHVRLTSDSSAEVTVPADLFAPCTPAGVPWAVNLRRGRARRTLTLPSVEVPLRADLSPGDHVILSDAVERGCTVELPDSGQYIAMPFTWDHAGDVRAAEVQPVLGRLSVSRIAPADTSHALPIQAEHGELPDAWLAASSGRVAGDLATHGTTTGPLNFRTLRTSVEQQNACVHSLGLGDTLMVAVERDRWGLFHGLHGDSAVREPWRVVAVSSRLLILFDRATLARARGNPSVEARLQDFLVRYDTLVAPFFRDLLPGWEPNGRIPLLVTDTSAVRARGYAYPSWTVGSRCAGEAGRLSLIWMDGRALFHSSRAQQAALLATSAHETAHLADFGTRAPAARADAGAWRDWTVEGYADLVRHLWTLPDVRTIVANADTIPVRHVEAGVGMRSLCGVSLPREKLRHIDDVLDYPAACLMVSSLVSRAVERGEPLSRVLETYSMLPARLTFTEVSNGLLGESRPAPDVVGEWLLSWYADELPGASPSIQNPMWNLRAFFPAEDLVDERIRPWGGHRSIRLRGIDASYVSVTTGSPVRVGWTAPDGSPLPADRTGLALLRIR